MSDSSASVCSGFRFDANGNRVSCTFPQRANALCLTCQVRALDEIEILRGLLLAYMEHGPDPEILLESSDGRSEMTAEQQEVIYAAIRAAHNDRDVDPDENVGPCARCDHDPACGFASVNGDWLCHDDDHSCYFEASIDAAGNGSRTEGE